MLDKHARWNHLRFVWLKKQTKTEASPSTHGFHGCSTLWCLLFSPLINTVARVCVCVCVPYLLSAWTVSLFTCFQTSETLERFTTTYLPLVYPRPQTLPFLVVAAVESTVPDDSRPNHQLCSWKPQLKLHHQLSIIPAIKQNILKVHRLLFTFSGQGVWFYGSSLQCGDISKGWMDK